MSEDNKIEQNLKIMEVVEKALARRKAESTACLSVFLTATAVWILAVALWEKLNKPIPPYVMTYGVEMIAVIMLAVTARMTHMKLQDMGITRKNLGASLLRGAVISLILVAVLIGFKLLRKPGEPLLDWQKFNWQYPITSILQEFLARGFLLTCLINIYDHPKKKHIAVILSSLLFTSLHLYYGFTFMVGAGLLSVMLGYIYLKDENIWGVSLIHFSFGMTGIMLSLV